MSYCIIGDSCTDLPESMKKDPHFRLVPLTLLVADETIIDDATFDQASFLKKVAACKECPHTACPSPEQFMQHFDEADDIYVVTLSSKLSGSYNSAVLAKNLYLEEHPGKNIEIIDSCSASVGQTLIAREIQKKAEEGKSFSEVVSCARSFRAAMGTNFVLESLEMLRKNGRLSNLTATICNVLNIKPVMVGNSIGEIEKLDQARGMKKALERMADYVASHAVNPSSKTLAISHCNNYKRALFFRDLVLDRQKFADVIIVDTAGVSSFYACDGGIIVSY